MKKACKGCGYLNKGDDCKKCTAKSKILQKKKGKDEPVAINKNLEKGTVADLKAQMSADQGVPNTGGKVPNVKQDFKTGKKVAAPSASVAPKASQSITAGMATKPKSMNQLKKEELEKSGVHQASTKKYRGQNKPSEDVKGQSYMGDHVRNAEMFRESKPEIAVSETEKAKNQSRKNLKALSEAKKPNLTKGALKIKNTPPKADEKGVHIGPKGVSTAGEMTRIAAEQKDGEFKDIALQEAKHIHKQKLSEIKTMKKPDLTKTSYRQQKELAKVSRFSGEPKLTKSEDDGSPKTRSGKAIPDVHHKAYNTGIKMRRYNNREITASNHMADGADKGKVLKRNLSDWSKEDHADAAKHHRNEAASKQAEWSQVVDKAHKETFGKPFRMTDYKISGIARSEYAEKHKDKLRSLAQESSKHETIAHTHDHLSRYGKVQKSLASGMSINDLKKAEAMINDKEQEVATVAQKVQEALSKIKSK